MGDCPPAALYDRRGMENRLNDLTGSQWLFWTNTVWETNYPVDATHPLRKAHGAMKPPGAMQEIIRFFTKKGEMVLDPFAGVGGTLLGAEICGRRALGIEIDPRWVTVYRKIQEEFGVLDGELVRREGQQGPARIRSEMRQGDCLEVMRSLPEGDLDALICDPPYGTHHAVKGFADETNFAMKGSEEGDFGTARDFDEFYSRMEAFGREAWRLLKDGRYLVVLCGDRYRHSEYLPLGVRVADVLRRAGFRLKGIKIWTNKSTLRPLRPYAVKTAFVPNITHQNVLILRKEESRVRLGGRKIRRREVSSG